MPDDVSPPSDLLTPPPDLVSADAKPPSDLLTPPPDLLPAPAGTGAGSSHGLAGQGKPQASPPDTATQPAPQGFLSTFGSSAMKGVGEALTDVAHAPTAFTDRPQQEDNSYVGHLLSKKLSEGYNDPNWWAATIGHGLGSSSPSLGLGVAGGLAGSAIAPGPGTVIGGATGFALGSALQTIAPAYQAARAAGLDHDAAVTRALTDTGIASAFGAAMGLAPGVSFFGKTIGQDAAGDAVAILKRPVSEALAQMFGVQPGLGAAQQIAEGASHGQMPTADELATGYVGNVGMGLGMVGAHKAIERGINAVRGGENPTPPVSPPLGDGALPDPTEQAARDRAATGRTATPGAPPQQGEAIGLKFPKGPSQRATVDQYFDGGNSVRLRFDDGSVRDFLTADVLRDQTEPPPPMSDVAAPAGRPPAGPGEAESFDLMMEGERAAEAARPQRAPSTPALGGDAIQALQQANALEWRAANDPNRTAEQRADDYAAAARLRRQYGASTEPTELTDEQRAKLAAGRASGQNMPIMGQSVPPIDTRPEDFSDEQLAAAAAIRRQAAAERAAEVAAAAAQKEAEKQAKIDAQNQKPPRRPDDLLDFLSQNGGVRDDTGDLTEMGADQWHLGQKFRRKLMRDDGQSLASAFEKANQAGYGPYHDEAELLDAIRDNLAGNPQFAASDMTQAGQWQESLARQKPMRDQLLDRAHELGLTIPDNWSGPEILAEIHEREGMMTDGAGASDLADRMEAAQDEWFKELHPDIYEDLHPDEPAAKAPGVATPPQGDNNGVGRPQPAAAGTPGTPGADAVAADGRAAADQGAQSPSQGIMPSTPEPRADIAAQIRVVASGQTTKDAVFVARDNEDAIPHDLPPNVAAVARPEGVLLTTNPEKAERFRDPKLTDNDLGVLLGYPVSKTEAVASGAPLVVRGTDAAGNVVAEALTSPQRARETAAAIHQQTPADGKITMASPIEAQQRRDELVSQEGPPPVAKAGTRAAPVKVERPEHIAQAERHVNQNPTEGQKEAGNYAKGHLKLHGLDITIENPKGSVRRGVGPDGAPWEVEMPAAYGYIKRTEGADGDHVDTYIGSHPDSERVFVVDQHEPGAAFDEHKAFIGFANEAEAMATYRRAFSDGSGMARLGHFAEMSVDEFKDWIKNGDTTAPAREHVERQFAEHQVRNAKEAAGNARTAGATKGAPFERPEDPFEKMQREHRERLAQADKIAAENDGPVVLQSKDRPDLGALIHPSADEPGKWQYTFFDRDGFSGHTVRDTKAEAVRLAMQEGFRDTNRNMLREFQGTDRWDQGNARADANMAARAAAPAKLANPMEVHAVKHTKTGADLFAVRLLDRVDGDRFKELSAAAKKLGGYYSSFRGKGAVPGWQFKSNDAAARFMYENGGHEPPTATAQDRRAAAVEQPPKPRAPEPIGTNAAGKPVYEDANGVRSYVDRGVRIEEPVGLRPTRNGYVADVAPARRSDDFKTAEERAATAPPADLVANNKEEPQAQEQPANVPAQKLFVEIGGTRYPVDSPQQASELFSAARDRYGMGGSDTPTPLIYDGTGRQIGYISYNGKVWEGTPQGWKSGMTPVYDPFSDVPRAAPMIERPKAAPEPPAQGGLLNQGTVPKSNGEGQGAPASKEAQNGVQERVPQRDAGAGSPDVQRAPAERPTGRVRPAEDRGSLRNAERPAGEGAEGQRGPAEEPRGIEGGGESSAVVDAGVSPEARPGDGGAAGRSAPDRGVTGKNFTLEPGAVEEARSPLTKARDNVAAIELAKKLLAEDRAATREEQAVLAKYVGWGGLSGAFPHPTTGEFGKGLEKVGARLKELLTEEEHRTAARSTQYAHYTAENVIRGMWDAVGKMGFKGGLVFEPGMGIGHFLGMMPPDIAARSKYQGVEMDHLTADIAKLLYPESGVRQADFTKTPIPDNTFDLVIGNPPFSDTVIKADPKYAARGFMLHDYFFAKSLDSVRPGGLLGFVTSAGTMNKLDDAARRYMAERADFVGGVRLPSSAFKQNAGTEVTTDVLFFRKRGANEEVRSNSSDGVYLTKANASGEAIGQPLMRLEPNWTQTVQREFPNPRTGQPEAANVSRYFAEHPEQVLGEEGLNNTQYAGARYGVEPRPGQDLTAELADALDRLPKDVMEAPASPEDRAALDFAATEKKEGSYYLQDGKLMQYSGGAGRPIEARGAGVKGGMSAADMQRVRQMIPVRDALRDVFRHDLARNDEASAEARQRLNRFYDNFVRQFGPINKANYQYRRPSVVQAERARAEAYEEARDQGRPWDHGDFDATPMIEAGKSWAEIGKARQAAREAAGERFNEGTFDPAEMPDVVIEKRPNIDPFMDDPESYRLRSIENYNEATGEASKKRIFTENILTHEEAPRLASAGDGVMWSLNKFGRLDLDAIAGEMGKDRAAIINELGDKVFRVPGTTDTYVTHDEYLSGDVVDKLAAARALAERDPEMRRNVAALEKAQPAPLSPAVIHMRTGMPWLPENVFQDFARDHLGIGEAEIKHSAAAGGWSVALRKVGDRNAEWATDDRSASQILTDVLNKTPPKIYRTYKDASGGTRTEFDAVATQAAQDKYNAIAGYWENGTRVPGEFERWIEANPKLADDLAALYNDKMNRTVLRQYDGSYLTTPGISADWQWRPHQQRVVARIVQSGNTYMAHAVGAGKTSAMIGAAMEMRRLGLVRKPMFAVPGHMLGQFAKEFYEQYPTARVAIADERRFHTDRRKQFMADVSQNDIDAVIIPHSSFGMIPISDEFQAHLIEEELSKLREALADVGTDQESRFTRKRIENQIEKMEQKLSTRGNARQDQGSTFEEMGVDFLFVDEAHKFRKLSYATRQSGLKGLSPEGSNMAWDLYSKLRYLDSQKPGRSVVLASGTPITNTMGELYSLSRYMQREELERRGLSHFDSWAATFGDTKTGLEQTPDGGYAPVTRFADFVNTPELYKMVGQVMDTVTPEQLEQYVVRPKLQGGERQMHMAPRTDFLDAYQADLGRRMQEIKDRKGPPQKGDDILLSVINDGRHSAIDPRFVDPSLPPDPNSKLNMMIDNVHRIWKETKNQQFYDPKTNYEKKLDRGPGTQMIFANLGIGDSREFSGYQWMKSEFVRRGIPRDQIAFIGDYKTAVARQKLFNDMNEGKVRILIGSTDKMGTGVNAQRRLVALHNQDPLWFPADDEQRVGRILRQGNTNPEIQVHDYSTKGTYDSTMWQMMGRKARFIEGFFRGDPEMREMEDLGAASMYEQASAMATADPRIIELTEKRQALDKALRRQAAHENAQYSMREQTRQHESKSRFADKRIAEIQQDIAQRQETKGNKFAMTVNGQQFTKRSEAAVALAQRVGEVFGGLARGADKQVGTIGGFPLMVRKNMFAKAEVPEYFLLRNGEHEGELNATGASGVIASAENHVAKLEDGIQHYQNIKADAATYAKQHAGLMGQEFKGGDEIARLKADVKDLTAQLTPKEEPKGPVMPVSAPGEAGGEDEAPAMQRGDGGERPAGKQVPIARGLTGEERPTDTYAAHEQEFADKFNAIVKQMAPRAEPRVYGSMRSTDERGEPEGPVYGASFTERDPTGARAHIIAGSLESKDPAGMARHEVFHHVFRSGLLDDAENRVLNETADREGWVDDKIKKDYGHLPPDRQREEGIAEAYRRSQEDPEFRKGLPGAVQKAFYKVGLFLRRVGAMARQVLGKDATADDIFQKIESGEVGRRGMAGDEDQGVATAREGYHGQIASAAEDAARDAGHAREPQSPARKAAKQAFTWGFGNGALKRDIDPQDRAYFDAAGRSAYEKGQQAGREWSAKTGVDQVKGFGETPAFQRGPRDEQPEVQPGGKDYLDDVADQIAETVKGSPPGTYARRLAQSLPPSDSPLGTKMLGRFEKFVIQPRTLAATDWRSARYWEEWRRKDVTANTLRNDWSEKSKSYTDLSPAQRRALHGVEELDRINGVIRPDDGRRIVVRNEGNDETEFSRPGQSIALDAKTTAAYHDQRALMRDVWHSLMDASAKRLGWHGDLDPDAIRAEAKKPMLPAGEAKRLNNVADLMEAMQAQERTGYTPLMRFGDYYIAVKPKEGTAEGSLGGFPETRRFELVESKGPFESLFGSTAKGGKVPAAAAKRIAELQKRYGEDFTIEHGYLAKNADALRKLDIPAVEKLFMALGQKDSELFGPMVEQLRDKMYEEMKAGFKKRARTVPGYSADFARARGSYLGWTSNHAADMLHGEAIRQAQEAYIDRHPDKDVQRYWRKWADYQNDPGEEMAKLRQFGFYWALAGNPSSMALIATHGPMVAHATLGVGHGYLAAGRALYGALAEGIKNIRFDTTHGLHVDMEQMGRTPAEKALIASAMKTGQVHAAAADDIRGLRQNAMESLEPVRKTWGKMLNIAASTVAVTDQMNRIGVLLAEHRLASKPGALDRMKKVWGGNEVFRQMVARDGLTPETAAKFMVDEGLFVWGKRNRAPVQRGTAGTMLFQFRNFETNYLGTLWKMMHRMGPEGKGAALFMLAGLGMLGGAAGLPFAQDLEKGTDALGKLITGIDPMAEAKIAALLEDAGFSQAGAEAILKGPSRAALGIDLTSRLGFGEAASKNLSPTEALGVVPSMLIERAMAAHTRATHGQPLGATAELLPTALRNLMRGTVVLPDEGVRTQKGATVIPKGKITGGEQVAQSLGFEPAAVARAYEARDYAYRAGKAGQDLHSRLLSQAAEYVAQQMEATSSGDTASAAVIEGQLKALLAAHPDQKISAKAIKEQLVARQNAQAAALKHAPKAARQAILNSPFVPPE